MFRSELKTFRTASIISFTIAITIAIANFTVGKQNLFLYLNTDLGKIGDFIFNYITYLGDGTIWVIFIIGVYVQKRKYTLVSILSLIISTIIAQGIKRYILPVEPRPISDIANVSQIHTITGVYVHEVGSFPSGHTTQVFTMYLLLCLLYNNNRMLWIGLAAALLVAYSRVYQAQHFPIDVAGGIVAALISVWLSVALQSKKISEQYG